MNKQHVPVPSTLLTRSSEEKTGQHINKIVPSPVLVMPSPTHSPTPLSRGHRTTRLGVMQGSQRVLGADF